jgi:ABC-type bacteriocin/lantibiotic exporter with double-glycine peptidase domain
MKVNNDIFSEINFTKLNSPIHRVADLIAAIISDILSYIIPNLLYVGVIGLNFAWLSPVLALIFLIGNGILILYYYLTYEKILKKNTDYEQTQVNSDGVLIDLLSNMDKIVYRGVIKEESDRFESIANKNIDMGIDYYSNSNLNATIMSGMLLGIFLVSLFYLINLKLKNKITHVMFMSSVSILTLFREKMSTVVAQLPEHIGDLGRIDISIKYFDHVNINFEEVLKNNRFSTEEIPFEKIVFDNVTYRYGNGKYVLNKKSFEISLNQHEIIGITGPSGSGKSTIVKLLLKMYPCQDGKIFIDGMSISELDPTYIRKNMTYVNQTSKLFDKKVIENMMYGCNDKETCDYFLKKVMKYPSIYKLYQNMNIYTKDSGLLGENLSGGQRQVINMIAGFINPSKILILDEPTNALDPTLKKEVIRMIKDFKQYKKCIIIISHDKDVFPLFDKEILMY